MITIPLTRGQVAVVDDVDADLAGRKWQAHPYTHGGGYYAKARIVPYTDKKMHRLILERIIGRALARSEQVDHIDGNGLNNRRGNLRLATQTENFRNCGKQRNNTSGFKGVIRHGNQWQARVQFRVNGRKKALHPGCFPTAEQAAIAYDFAAALLHGEFARLNFPLEV